MKNLNSVKIIVIIFLTLTIWAVWANKAIEINYHEVISPLIPDAFEGFKIAHLSDLHNESFGEDNEKLIDVLRENSPDIIVITGDIIDSRRTNMDVAENFVSEAVKIAPVYYVNGNHEARISGYDDFEKRLISCGVAVLNNESIFLKKGDDSINLIGLRDPSFDRGEYIEDTEGKLTDRLENLKKEGYNILLSHRPEYFEVYVKSGIDLVFTGHAHGGQFRLPFIGGLYAPGQGIFPKYTSGMHTSENTSMLVSRGLGNSIIPIRINNRPEVIFVMLKSEKYGM
ncbi:MAG: metallophosphoesterase [Eubacteriaceae bacterium]|nr:metallophosphoesterase [Eubacteriaceae bacterium]